MKKAVLQNFKGKLHTCNFIKMRLQHWCSPEYCEVFKNTYFEEHLLTAASDFLKQLQNNGKQLLLY